MSLQEIEDGIAEFWEENGGGILVAAFLLGLVIGLAFLLAQCAQSRIDDYTTRCRAVHGVVVWASDSAVNCIDPETNRYLDPP